MCLICHVYFLEIVDVHCTALLFKYFIARAAFSFVVDYLNATVFVHCMALISSDWLQVLAVVLHPISYDLIYACGVVTIQKVAYAADSLCYGVAVCELNTEL